MPAAEAPSSLLFELMNHRVPTRRASFHTLGSDPVPHVVNQIANGREFELVWRNQLGGLTFRIEDQFLKWNPRHSGVDLERERIRLGWLAGRHPAPRVIEWGSNDESQWFLSVMLPGEHAVGDTWRRRRSEAIRAIATGLWVLHAIPIVDFPAEWTRESWVSQAPTSIGPRPRADQLVIVHGDACAPNTLISTGGEWIGNVDFGALALGDRWADLAIASLSLDWNFGEGHQPELFDAYGIQADPERIRYYRALWELES
jgi:kanamycin kinase